MMNGQLFSNPNCIAVPLQLLQDYVEPSETERSLGVWGIVRKTHPCLDILRETKHYLLDVVSAGMLSLLKWRDSLGKSLGLAAVVQKLTCRWTCITRNQPRKTSTLLNQNQFNTSLFKRLSDHLETLILVRRIIHQLEIRVLWEDFTAKMQSLSEACNGH